jgi:AraC family transcriptional regulator, transcriptional activator of pobA
MPEMQTIELFYQKNLNWVPENLKTGIGHFNVFRFEEFVGKHAKSVPYSRRDYFKVSLIIGHTKINYADKTLVIQKQGLLFSNPQIPYNWERLDGQRGGYVCVFTSDFFYQFGKLNDYTVFQPGGNPVFELNDEQCAEIAHIFERMFDELSSTYQHKYDAIRNCIFEILHKAMKMVPMEKIKEKDPNALQRVSLLFLELLERQFPIEDSRQRIQLRSASAFAEQLFIHVNYLNKAIKETTQKTTSHIISERIIQESKILLRNTNWNVSEIAYSLGFEEVTNFNNFFKKNLNLTPSQFRKI